MIILMFIVGVILIIYPHTLSYRVQEWKIQQRREGKSVITGFLIIPVGMVAFLLGVSIMVMAWEVAHGRFEFQLEPGIPYLSIVLGSILCIYYIHFMFRMFYTAVTFTFSSFRKLVFAILNTWASLALFCIGHNLILDGYHCLKTGLFS